MKYCNKIKYSSLDILVSNAGISPAPKRIEDLDVEEYLKVININQIGSFLAIKSVILVTSKKKLLIFLK